MITRLQVLTAGGPSALVSMRAGWSARLMVLPRKFLVGVAAFLMALVLTGCGGAADSSSVPMVGDQPVPANGGDGGYQEQAVPMEDGDAGGDTERMIIRTKVLRLEVEKTVDAVEAIRESARTHEGTISDLEVATDSEGYIYRHQEDDRGGGSTELRGWVTVRVPTDGYEAFVAEVSKLGVVKFQSEASSDVTQEYVDLSARLENLRAQEVRLREFFEAAKDVDDMLSVEAELGRVRGDIESMDAQVTYLERQAAMATITVELTEPRDVVRPGGESWGFVAAITAGVRGAAGLITGLLSFVIAVSPLLVLGVIGFLVLRPILRRRRERAAKVPQPWSGPYPQQHPAPQQASSASPQPAPASTEETQVSPEETPIS